MTIVDSFFDFTLAAADYATKCPKSWRKGQMAFNLLSRVRPDLAEMVAGSDFDPFYNDDNLVEFYGYLARNW